MAQTTAVASTGAVSESPKGKTKAKKRYLKAKKERRKQRKAEAPHAHTLADQSHVTDANGDEQEAAPSSRAGSPLEPLEPQPEKSPERPRKRRKHAIQDEEGTTATIEDGTGASARHSGSVHLTDIALPALPRFPQPTQPDAPSKTTLALQGQDKALIEAELIDSRKTVSIDAVEVSEGTRRRLKELGIQQLFAVQTAVIPFLLSDKEHRSLYLPYGAPRDLCVSAPTGSGKTLAYVVPIVEILASRVVTRLRALIVLPTRDLVTQVREIFEEVAKGRGLKIATATGQHSFAHEQAQLIADRSPCIQGGSSKVDVLICTPGRLIDHLNSTPNFSLQHLRYLVVDEADRLLAQSFQDWLVQVLAATRPASPPVTIVSASQQLPSPEGKELYSNPDALAPAFLPLLRDVPHVHTVFDERKETSCQKLLFSATLTRDPSKIVALDLRDPKYFIVQGQPGSEADHEHNIVDVVLEKFTMPATLSEHMIICDTAQKPLLLFHLIHAHHVKNAIIFTKSAESTTRLVQLFKFFEASRTTDNEAPVVLSAYSSDLSPGDRKAVLDKFKTQEIHILVCSDLISRGIDITHVEHVVSYDAPVDMRKYVHRVGRTARAGREGHAWTLVEEQEARHFKSMLRDAEHLAAVKRLRIQDKDLSALAPHYETALGKLKQLYARS